MRNESATTLLFKVVFTVHYPTMVMEEVLAVSLLHDPPGDQGFAQWIAANMLAWLAAMPIIFWAIDAAQKGQPILQAVLLLAAALLITGAVVGAIHGAFLARLTLDKKRDCRRSSNPFREVGYTFTGELSSRDR